MTPSPQPHRATVPEARSKATSPPDAYASAEQSKALLAVGAAFRRDRIGADDMLSTDQAAELAGTSRVTSHAWVRSGRAIGVQHLRRGYRLPAWQFEPGVHAVVLPVAQQLATADGWQLLRFFETAHSALDGETPRQALERGVLPERVISVAAGLAY